MAIQHETPAIRHGIELPAWFERFLCRPGYRFPFHDHGFYEVCWVERGEIRHGLDGATDSMRPGEVRFIHPATRHALAADQLTMLANLAISGATIRHLEPVAGTLPFHPGRAVAGHLAPEAFRGLVMWSDLLSDPALSRMRAEAFLLWLLDAVRLEGPPAPSQEPTWLQMALAGFDHPAQLATGVRGLVALAGRSEGHVNRTIRRRFGCSTIQFINRRRLLWLAQQLRQTGTPVPELAEACGLPHLGNLHRQFRGMFGCTPLAYREREQLAMSQTLREHVEVAKRV